MSDMVSASSEIKDYIDDYRDLSNSYENLFFKEKNTFTMNSTDEDVILLGRGILDKYKKDLDNIKITKKLTHEEQRKYYCNPWYLSYDLYGTVEFWYLILEANSMYSAIELTQETIQVYDASLPRLVDSILALEEEFIDSNEEEIDSDSIEIAPEMLEYEDDEEEDNDNNIEEDDDEE